MRDLIVTENITLDGVIDATEGWFAPAGDEADVDESDVVDAIREHREAADAFLVGRVTFEQMRGYWPLQTDDATGISDYLNRVSKYVVSRDRQHHPGPRPHRRRARRRIPVFVYPMVLGHARRLFAQPRASRRRTSGARGRPPSPRSPGEGRS
jgi:hypothetical protein